MTTRVMGDLARWMVYRHVEHLAQLTSPRYCPRTLFSGHHYPCPPNPLAVSAEYGCQPSRLYRMRKVLGP